jgi:hypothetical protein
VVASNNTMSTKDMSVDESFLVNHTPINMNAMDTITNFFGGEDPTLS